MAAQPVEEASQNSDGDKNTFAIVKMADTFSHHYDAEILTHSTPVVPICLCPQWALYSV